ncbi:hypothetical protein U1Q18_039797 [Sarracenia purpurea var. burkii]
MLPTVRLPTAINIVERDKLCRLLQAGVSQAMQIVANIAVLERACDFSSITCRSAMWDPDPISSKAPDDFMGITKNVNWTRDDMPAGPHEYINEVESGALEHISNSIVAAFLSDSMKRFNANAVVGIIVINLLICMAWMPSPLGPVRVGFDCCVFQIVMAFLYFGVAVRLGYCALLARLSLVCIPLALCLFADVCSAQKWKAAGAWP